MKNELDDTAFAPPPQTATVGRQPLEQPGWLSESLDDGFGYSIWSDQMLVKHQSPFQDIEVHSNKKFGQLLRINESFMTSEKDEFFHHENLVHVPSCVHPRPHTALIIGGGDGGLAEEILKHNTITRVVLVEIDAAVIEVSRLFLRGVHNGVLDSVGGDARLETVLADGAQYMAQSEQLFDLIILDSTGKNNRSGNGSGSGNGNGGPSELMYSSRFYAYCAARLAAGGLMSLHIGSPFAQPQKIMQTLSQLVGAFAVVRPYLVSVPLLGEQSMMASASQEADPAELGPRQCDAVIHRRGLTRMQFYNGQTHQAAMALPNYIRELVAPTGARWQ